MKYTIIAAALILTSCKKKHETPKGNVTFYNLEFGNDYGLAIDGENMGQFHASVEEPKCGQGAKNQIIIKSLEFGPHTYSLRHNDFNIDTIDFEVNSDCRIIKVEK